MKQWMSMSRCAAVAVLCMAPALALPGNGTKTRAADGNALVEFELLGCAVEDARGDEPAEVRRLITTTGRVNFLVRHVQGCGLDEGVDPTYRREGDTLFLDYRLVNTDDAVVMCDCMYEAQFRFDDSMGDVRAVEFKGERVQILSGD